MRVLVTDGTGTLGRHVVPRLRAAECDVRVLSRHSHPPENAVEFVTGDLATGDGIEAAVAGVGIVVHCDGIEAAVAGVGIVVHCAGTSKGDKDKARNLVVGRALMEAAIEAARARGADHMDLGTSEDDVPRARSTRALASSIGKAEATGPQPTFTSANSDTTTDRRPFLSSVGVGPGDRGPERVTW